MPENFQSNKRVCLELAPLKWWPAGFSTIIVKDLAVSQNEASLTLIKAVNGGSPFIHKPGLIPACPLCSRGSARLGSGQISLRTVERFCGFNMDAITVS